MGLATATIGIAAPAVIGLYSSWMMSEDNLLQVYYFSSSFLFVTSEECSS
jgi:hypothetical protein